MGVAGVFAGALRTANCAFHVNGGEALREHVVAVFVVLVNCNRLVDKDLILVFLLIPFPKLEVC